MNPYLVMVSRVQCELGEIKKITERIQLGWEKAQKTSDDLYIDSVALNLHDFYNGLERLFEFITENIDGMKLSGNRWHQELLRQMTFALNGIRPAVITLELSEKLDEYRSFRHLVRNVYAHQFKPERIRHLIENISIVFKECERQLSEFCQYLRSLDSSPSS